MIELALEQQERMIAGGFQKYRYHLHEGKIASITCLVCGTTSNNLKAIEEQYCEKCNKHLLTPSGNLFLQLRYRGLA